MATPSSVDDYLDALPVEKRVVLQRIRETVRAVAPAAIETISYQMPAFKVDGRFLLSYAAFKDHCSIFPGGPAVQEAIGDELIPYVTGKGTLSFPVDRPMPAPLVRKIVRTLLEQHAARARRKAGR